MSGIRKPITEIKLKNERRCVWKEEKGVKKNRTKVLKEKCCETLESDLDGYREKQRRKRTSEGTMYEPVKSKIFKEKIRNGTIILEKENENYWRH